MVGLWFGDCIIGLDRTGGQLFPPSVTLTAYLLWLVEPGIWNSCGKPEQDGMVEGVWFC